MVYDVFIIMLFLIVFIGLLLGCTLLYAVAEKVCNPHLTWRQIFKNI